MEISMNDILTSYEENMAKPVNVLDIFWQKAIITIGQRSVNCKDTFPCTAVKNCLSVLILVEIDLVPVVQCLHKYMQPIYIFSNHRLKLHIYVKLLLTLLLLSSQLYAIGLILAW